MKYIEYVNGLIKEAVARPEHAVLFGQNMNAGSCLGGLTRGFSVKPAGKIWNSTNAENSLVGFGFGLMLNGAQAGFFMKQMDFLVLGIDHLVNTYNIIRNMKHQPKEGSFTIAAMVVDSGWEGPQSSLNNFADICSIAHVPGYAVTNKTDADFIVRKHLMQPGFRILGISQRLGKTEIIDPGSALEVYGAGEIFKYKSGEDATLVSFNFSFPQAYELEAKLRKSNIHAAFFNVNSAIATDWTPIKESAKMTKKIIVVDDSKSVHVAADALLAELCTEVPLVKKIFIKRQLGENWLHPASDEFVIDDSLLDTLKG
ncbi:MAG TPA: transketolase C-terminal domain-containing protein [Candidatus Paceibacterota bacterium]|nr:transketolase C-terminal domain-containing protein [Candidatus Paceibacterota bacterium]